MTVFRGICPTCAYDRRRVAENGTTVFQNPDKPKEYWVIPEGQRPAMSYRSNGACIIEAFEGEEGQWHVHVVTEQEN